jgi:hypothetical protein
VAWAAPNSKDGLSICVLVDAAGLPRGTTAIYNEPIARRWAVRPGVSREKQQGNQSASCASCCLLSAARQAEQQAGTPPYHTIVQCRFCLWKCQPPRFLRQFLRGNLHIAHNLSVGQSKPLVAANVRAPNAAPIRCAACPVLEPISREPLRSRNSKNEPNAHAGTGRIKNRR